MPKKSMQPAARRKAAAAFGRERPITQRSRVTNGKVLLQGVDARSVWVRRAKDLAAGYASDLSGIENLSQAQIAIMRRAITLQVELESWEAALARGEPIDLKLFAYISQTLTCLLRTLGLKRVARDVTPNLRDYLKGAQSSEAAAS